MVIHLTDAPFPIDQIAEALVTFTEVRGRVEDSPVVPDGWHTLLEETQTFDLLQLRDGATAVLLDAEVPAGVWSQFRFVVESAQIRLVDGRVFDLDVPSGAQSGLKVDVDPPLLVAGGLSPELLLDFDLEESFVVLGNPNTPAGIRGFKLRPVLRATNLSEDGRIVGTVRSNASTPDAPNDDVPIEGASVTATLAGVDVATAVTGPDGGYALPGLPAATDYAVTADERRFVAETETGVEVVAANATTVDFRLTPAFGDLRGIVVGGADQFSLRPVAGARVFALGQDGVEAVTDAQGRFLLETVPAGEPVTVVADALDQSLGRVSLVTSVVATEVTESDRVWILPEVDFDAGVELELDADGRTTSEHVVTHPSVAASVRIPAGTLVDLPDDVSFPAGVPSSLAIGRLSLGAIPNPLPGASYAPVTYSLQPEGTRLEGFELTLPNEQSFAAGVQVQTFVFDPSAGQFVEHGPLVVSSDGTTLTGPGGDVLGLAAAVSPGLALPISGDVDSSARALRRVVVQSAGRSLAVFVEPGLGALGYSGEIPVHADFDTPFDVVYVGENAVNAQAQRFVFNRGPPITNPGGPSPGPFFQPAPRMPGAPPPAPPPLPPQPLPPIQFEFRNGVPEVVGPPRRLGIGVTGDGTAVRDAFAVVGGLQKPVLLTATADFLELGSPALAVPPPVLPDGPYDLTFRYLLSNGTFRWSRHNRVGLLDATAPAVSFFPLEGGVLGPNRVGTNQGSIRFQVGVGDPVGGILDYEVQTLVGGSWQRVPGFSFPTPGVQQGEESALKEDRRTVVLPLQNGLNQFRVLARDTAAGASPNVRTSNPEEVLLDRAAPTLTTVFEPPFVRDSSARIEFTTTDDAGLDRVELLEDGAVVQTLSVGGLSSSGDFTVFSAGQHEYTVRSVDRSGNAISSASQQYVFDDQAPSVAASAPTTSTGGTIPVSISAVENGLAGLESFDLFRQNVTTGTSVLVGSGSLVGQTTFSTSFNDAPPSDGRLRYRLEVTDAAGNTGIGTSSIVLRDSQAPAITFPFGPGAVRGPGPEVWTILLDDGLGVDQTSIAVTLDGALLSHTVLGTTTLPSGVSRTTVQVRVPRVVDGDHVAGVSAADQVGRTSSASVPFTKDNLAPEISSLTPESSTAPTRTASQAFRAEYDDGNGTGVVGATLVLDSIAPDGTTSTTVVTPQATVTPTAAEVTLALPDGRHTLSVTPTDGAGLSTTASTSVLVDTTPPALTATAPPPAPAFVTDRAAPLRVALDDGGGGGVDPTSARVFLDGQEVSASAQVTADTLTLTAPAPVTDGPHSYTVEVADLAGNVGSTVVAFQVDATPPTAPGVPAVGIEPLPSGPTGATALARWIASDDGAGSGVSHYVLRRSDDGGETFTTVATTSALEAEIDFPPTEATRFELVAVDAASNASAPTRVKGCETYALNDPDRPVDTSLEVEVLAGDGSPITSAVVVETSTGTLLPHSAGGVYRSAPLTAPAGQGLTLEIGLGGFTYVSGPLLPRLPEDTATDFGTVTIVPTALERSVFATGGRTPPPPGTAGIGATIGEPTAAGPPLLVSSNSAHFSGFWPANEAEGLPVVRLLQLPPVLCGRFVPIWFEVVADLDTVDVALDFSTDDGATFTPITIAAGDVTGLEGTPVGLRYLVLWDAGADLGERSLADLVLRASPAGAPGRGDTLEASLIRSFRVSGVSPTSGALEIDPAGAFEIDFSSAPTSDPGPLADAITLTDVESATAIALDLQVSGARVTATPSAPLAPGTRYQLAVRPGLPHVSGALAFDQDEREPGLQPFLAHFRTSSGDTQPPRIVSSTPANGADDVSAGSDLVVVFDEPLDGPSVNDQTFTLTSVGGTVPTTTGLRPDGRTVDVAPNAPLVPGNFYSLSVNTGVRDLAGNRIARHTAVSFTTDPGAALAPPTPTITSPAPGEVVTEAQPPIRGTGQPGAEIRLVVSGLLTDVRVVVESDGTWELIPFPLADGPAEIQVFASGPGGSPASGLTPPRDFLVKTDRLEATTPPVDRQLYEITAGFSGDSGRTTIELEDPALAGLPIELDVTARSRVDGEESAGIDRPWTIDLAAANGGDSFTVAPGWQLLSGSAVVAADGSLSFDVRGSDVNTDRLDVRIRSALDGSSLFDPVQVDTRDPTAFAQFLDTPTEDAPGRVKLALRGRYQTPDGPQIVSPSGYAVEVVALDTRTGQPTDAVRIDGVPGSEGVVVATGPDGCVIVDLEVVDGSVPVSLAVTSEVSFTPVGFGDFETFEPSLLGESAPIFLDPIDRSPGFAFTSLRDPNQNPSTGTTATLVFTLPCPPYGTNPVFLHNGGKVESRVDLAIPGRGVHFAWTRVYKSFVLYDGPMGARWTHGYDQRLEVLPSGDVDWLTGTARSETFLEQPDGSFDSPEGFFNRLSVENGEGTIRFPDGTRFVFRPFTAANAPGKLAEIRDRHGNRLRLEYGTSGPEAGQLTALVDALGRRIEVAYTDQGRIATVTDFLGRQVRYDYDAAGNLVRATSPVVLETTEGEPIVAVNQFPDGKPEVYGYTRGFADERANHLLTAVVAPNQAIELTEADLTDQDLIREKARLAQTYDLDPDSFSYLRVIRQRRGGQAPLPDWTGQTGPRNAGGEYAFAYEPLTVPADGSLNHPVSKTTLVDRSGNLTEYFHNRNGQCVRVREHTNRGVRPEAPDPEPGEDPPFFEATCVFNADGLRLNRVNALGNRTRWIYGQEDLNRDGVLTPGEDRNGDGDFDDPEDVQPEDDPAYAFDPGDGQLDALPRVGEINLLRAVRVPDAERGDSRGGVRARTATFSYEPVYNQLRTATDPRGHDPDYTPQNGGVTSPERYTATTFFDYQQGSAATTLTALAAELGEDEATTQALLDAAGVVLGLGDLNASPLDDSRTAGDPVRLEAPTVRLTSSQTVLRAFEGDATQEVVTLMEWNARGQPVRSTDAEGNVHQLRYYPENDPDGDGEDLTAGVSSDPFGYLRETRTDVASTPGRNTGADPAPAVIESEVRYDRVGNVIGVTDPRGIRHAFQVNPLNQVVVARTATDTTSLHPSEPDPALVAFDYASHLVYDANDNVVAARRENAGERDGTGQTVSANPFWARRVAYDILDNPVVTLAEVDPVADDAQLTVDSPNAIVTRVAYTPSEQVELVTKPEGNQVAYFYDERHLPFQVIDGFGSPDAGTYRSHYDLNGNRKLAVDAEKHNPGKNPGFPGDVTEFILNGFDEVHCAFDGEGNFAAATFDPTGRQVRRVRFGPPEEGHPRLAEVEIHTDELGRVFRTDARIFTTELPLSTVGLPETIPVAGDPVPPGEDEAIHLSELDRLGRIVHGVDPKGDDTFLTWDGASRLVRALGPAFADRQGQNPVRNEVLLTYNQASQVTEAVQIDRSPVAPDETFRYLRVYDALGRPARFTDPIGQTSRVVYDSRHNVIAASDAKSSALFSDPLGLFPGQINGHGNVAQLRYDGISRPIQSDVLLKQGGKGNDTLDLLAFTSLDTSNPVNADGRITTRRVYDRNSRLVQQTDDNGNPTTYGYDERDRPEAVLAADRTVVRTIYDADSLVEARIDRNGTRIDCTYDGAHRLLTKEVTRRAQDLEGTGQAVEGTTLQAWEWDGLSRPRVCVDDNDPLLADDMATSFRWDSLSRLLGERHRFRVDATVQPTSTTTGKIQITATAQTVDREVVSVWDRDSNRTAVTYPTTGRTLGFQRDGQDRKQVIEDALGEIAGTEWIGSRPALTDFRNGVRTSFGYDQKRRPTVIDHVAGGGTGARVVGFTYQWDRTDHRTAEGHLPATGVQSRLEQYAYDSAYRVTDVFFGDARPATSYQIDGVGNWASRTEGGERTEFNTRQNGVYAFDVMNEVFREATFDPVGTLAGEDTPTHDQNGNRIAEDDLRLVFDAFDRLIRVVRRADGETIGRYRYDAFGRRVERVFEDPATGLTEEVLYVSDGAQEIEELDGQGNLRADYVYGARYVDEVCQIRRPDGSGGFEELYLHQSSIFTVHAVTDASGAVVERYRYGSIYGAVTVTDGGGGARAPPDEVGNPWRFQGRRFDAETGFYFFRRRYLDPEAGRFVSRDPLGLWGDPSNLGNAYVFCASDPVNCLDPFGLDGVGLGDEPGWRIREYNRLHQRTLARERAKEQARQAESTMAEDVAEDLGDWWTNRSTAGKAGDILGWTDAATAGDATAAEFQQGAYGWAALYGVGTLFLGADATINTIPVVGWAKAGAFKLVKVGGRVVVVAVFERGARRGGREVVGEGVERGVRAGADPCASATEGAAKGPGGGSSSPSPTGQPLDRTGADGGGAGGHGGGRSAAAGGLPDPRDPLDPFPHPQHAASQPFGPGLAPGEYVFVRDVSGTVHVAPSAPHMHPQVLGGAQPATGAGTVTVGSGGTIDEVTNASGTFQFGEEILEGVVDQLAAQGGTVSPDVVLRGYRWD